MQTHQRRHGRRIAFLRANHRFASKMLASCLSRRQNNRPDCFDLRTNPTSRISVGGGHLIGNRGRSGFGSKSESKKKNERQNLSFSFLARSIKMQLHIFSKVWHCIVMFAHFATMRGILYFILSYQFLFGACPPRWHPLPVQ